MTELTHRDLCEIGAKWCKRPASQNGHGCNIAIVEGCADHENADVIGFRHSNPSKGSVLIEVKVSRSDFLADKKKPHRAKPETGMGKWRYFLCPENLITVDDLKAFPQWGLLYGYPNGRIKMIVGPFVDKPNWKERDERLKAFAFDQYNLENEQVLLIKSLSRFEDLDDMIKLQRENGRVASLSMKLSEENHKLKSENNLHRNNVQRKLNNLLQIKSFLKQQGITYTPSQEWNYFTLFDVHELEEHKKRIEDHAQIFNEQEENPIIGVINDELEIMQGHQIENLIESCQMRYKLDLNKTVALFIKDHIRADMSKQVLIQALSANTVDTEATFEELKARRIIEPIGELWRFTESFQQFSFSYIYDRQTFRKMNP